MEVSMMVDQHFRQGLYVYVLLSLTILIMKIDYKST